MPGLRGKVTSSATGLPLAGITVSLYQRVGSGVFVASTVTNYRGNYFFDSLPGGTYVVFTSNSLGYRDEIYNPESDQRGTAEIIVAKHRNGPTGVTRLAFLDHFTKFANMARDT